MVWAQGPLLLKVHRLDLDICSFSTALHTHKTVSETVIIIQDQSLFGWFGFSGWEPKDQNLTAIVYKQQQQQQQQQHPNRFYRSTIN